MKANKSNFYGYNKKLQSYANKLRKRMTKAEACLWKYGLRARQRQGYQFRRQRPVLYFIADFLCLPLKLVIEVDGITHQWEETIRRDKRKDRMLQEAGFVVLRFTDEEVLDQMNYVVTMIDETIDRLSADNE